MALERKVDSLTDIPEAIHEYYTEQEDGTFILAVGGVVGDDEVENLRKTVRKERDARKEWEKKAKSLESIDPDEYQRLKDEAEERRKKGLADKGLDPAVIEAEVEKRTQKALQDKDAEIDGYKQRLIETDGLVNTLVVENRIRAAAETGGALENAIDMIVAEAGRKGWSRNGENAVLLDGDGNPVYGADGKQMEPAEWIAVLKQDRPFLFRGSKGTGASDQPGPGPGLQSKRIKDMSNAEKMAYIDEHGLEAWEKKIENEPAS